MSCDRGAQAQSGYRFDSEGVLQGAQHAGLWLSFDGLRGWRKRRYKAVFVNKLADAMQEASENQT